MHDFSELRGFFTEQVGDFVIMGDDTGAVVLAVQAAGKSLAAFTGALPAGTWVDMDAVATRHLVDQLAARWKACTDVLRNLDSIPESTCYAEVQHHVREARAVLRAAVKG